MRRREFITLAKSAEAVWERVRRLGIKKPNRRLLRARRERPRGRAGDERDELAPFHSITSSAVASIREDRSTLPIENQSFVNSGEGVLSLHFLFQDLTQYQE
jgi:hypothetical protein